MLRLLALCLVQAQNLDTLSHWQLAQQGRLGQQQTQAAVGEHLGDAFAGRLRVQRDISTAGLEHREQGDPHVQRTLKRHTDQYLGADTRPHQALGQAVAATLQLGIAQAGALPFASQHQRDRLGRTRCLGLKALVGQRRCLRCRCSQCPSLQLAGFSRIEQFQLADSTLRVGQHAAQQVAPVAGHALDGGGIEQIGGVGEGRQQAFAFLAGFQHQVAGSGMAAGAGHALFGVQMRQLQAATQAHALDVGDQRLMVVHDLEQRVVALAAVGLQRLQ